jgi:hypothetical protein
MSFENFQFLGRSVLIMRSVNAFNYSVLYVTIKRISVVFSLSLPCSNSGMFRQTYAIYHYVNGGV